MKKTLFILTVIFILGLFHSCSVFKAKKSSIAISEVKKQNDIRVQKERADSLSNIKIGVSENTSKVLSEEITIKNNASLIPVELTARFRVDTARSLNGDTALTLVDINDSNISVAIYQNRRTNELTAKVTTKGGVKNIPFSEMQIKRNYSETSSKTDTTKTSTSVSSLKVDSVNKSKSENYSKTKDKQSEPTSKLIWVSLGLAVIIGVFLYFKFKR